MFRPLSQSRWVLGFPAMPIVLGAAFDLTYGVTVPHDVLSITAQVVAVLVLAVALETRLLSIRDTSDPELGAITVGVALFLGLGQVFPLLGLLLARDWLVFAVPGLAATALGLVFVLAVAVFDPIGSGRLARRSSHLAASAEAVRREAGEVTG